MRTETKKTKKKGQSYTLPRRREKRRKKMVVDDNLTIIRSHAPHHVEEDKVAHPKKMAEYQVWSLSSVTRVVIIARTPPTRLTRANRFFY